MARSAKYTVTDRAQKGDSKSGHREIQGRNDHQNSCPDRRMIWWKLVNYWQVFAAKVSWLTRRSMRTGFGSYWLNGALRPLFHQNPIVKIQHHAIWRSTSGGTSWKFLSETQIIQARSNACVQNRYQFRSHDTHWSNNHSHKMNINRP